MMLTKSLCRYIIHASKQQRKPSLLQCAVMDYHRQNAICERFCSSRFLSSSSPSDSDSSDSDAKQTTSAQKQSTSQASVFKKNDKKQSKEPKPIDVIGETLLNAVEGVVEDLHKNDDGTEAKRNTKRDLIEKLSEHEKETFHAAADSQIDEMLSDKTIIDLLSGASKQKAVPASRAAEVRHARRGLLLLRREIFYQAKQSGYSASDARAIAERAVTAAEARSIAQHSERNVEQLAELDKKIASEMENAQNEQKFYDYAFRIADKMLYPGDYRSGMSGEAMPQTVVEPNPKAENIFSTDLPRLDIFNAKNLSELKEHSLDFWAKSDANAARIWNQSFGPKNGFEEMIELTKKGKMWPYPIDNEYLLGEESNIGFDEHIFLERKLADYHLPRTGPIAHFMELVCVGLSKNPYMTAEKKKSHLEWFANYFNEKKIAEIERLHKEEQIAAENAL